MNPRSERRQVNRPTGSWLLLLGILVSPMVATLGCGDVRTITSPEPQPTVLRSSHAMLAPAAESDTDWYLLASAEVKPEDEDKSVGGGRYELTFPLGAVRQTTVITISEWDSHVLECEFGPHGIAFDQPVTLRIDYSGTNADPSSSNYDGSLPEFRWLNPETNLWEVLAGTDDPEELEYYVQLTHFSRYALFGKAGW